MGSYGMSERDKGKSMISSNKMATPNILESFASP